MHTTKTIWQNGKKIVKYITKPSEVDRAVQEVWAQIRKGNIDKADLFIQKFLEKYGKHLFRDSEFEIGDIDTEKFFRELTQMNHSVGGMDGFGPEDLTMVSQYSVKFIVDMLNAIELGANWPSDINKGRASFLAKDPTKLDDPNAYRPLMVLPIIYRRWASMIHSELVP